ncbi:GNAT family N-acetyltransferase [Pseudovibrio ascidiaceicola]|uniref:GNAT family N-acetyltransferase n=1 Tax=Pseudovibrio ascidiaceicola TaxID=285279 RepID=UPI000D688D53|nr:GNAT family N-acetyltransferase [Pseudovibrio ascidiaceicola]
MSVELKPMTLADVPVLTNLFQLYLYDMSKYMHWPVSAAGGFEFDENIVLAYFHEAGHHPYFIMQAGEIAGFALVRQYPYDATLIDMGQFFVLGKFTRQRLGQEALKTCLKLHPGDWQVRVLSKNAGALAFWTKTISELTNATHRTCSGDYQGTEMTFLHFSSQNALASSS